MRAVTLVELMIAVGIVAILAAIAVPELQMMQLKAKRAEIYPNLSGIRDAAIAYIAAHDEIPAQAIQAPSWPKKTKQEWTGGSPWDEMGWAPDGDVYGSYSFTTESGWLSWTSACGDTDPLWAAYAHQDLDGDKFHKPVFAVTDVKLAQPTYCLCSLVDSDTEFEAW